MAPEICHKHSHHCQGCEITFQTLFLADGGWVYFCILLTEI